MTDALTVDDEAAAAVAVAPRVSKEDIEDKIRSVNYISPAKALNQSVTASDGLRTFTLCIIEMTNGFIVTGESAPASPENFHEDLGKQLAYENAFRKLKPLEGYLLRERLHLGAIEPVVYTAPADTSPTPATPPADTGPVITDANDPNSVPMQTSGQTISAGEGNDTIPASAADDGPVTPSAGEGNDTVEAPAGNDTTASADGNDTVEADEGANDSLDAGAGNDSVSDPTANDSVSGGTGNDTVSTAPAKGK